MEKGKKKKEQFASKKAKPWCIYGNNKVSNRGLNIAIISISVLLIILLILSLTVLE